MIQCVNKIKKSVVKIRHLPEWDFRVPFFLREYFLAAKGRLHWTPLSLPPHGLKNCSLLFNGIIRQKQRRNSSVIFPINSVERNKLCFRTKHVAWSHLRVTSHLTGGNGPSSTQSNCPASILTIVKQIVIQIHTVTYSH